MHRPILTAMCLTALAVTPLVAAEPLPWPWTTQMPPDPALAVLTRVDGVTASVDKEIVHINVKATARAPGYTELALTPRIGDPRDRIFAFDIRGRASQDIAGEEPSPVTLDIAYKDAPIGKFDIVEINGKDNCVGYSIPEAREVGCTSKSIAQ